MEKKYYNSIEWGILKKNIGNQRSNGIEFLKNRGFNVSDNVSYSPDEFYESLENINKRMKESHSSYIVIFEPVIPEIKRRNIPGQVTSLKQIVDFIKDNNLNLNDYKITIIERILALPESFCGVVMTDGKSNTVIEILLDSINLIDLTSAGVDPSQIKSYDFNYFGESRIIPYLINRIKLDCEHYQGYYEFIYGKYNGKVDIYYTYYSDNKNYLNILDNPSQQLCLKKTNLN